MSYRPSNEVQFFSKLEVVLELKALSSPLATVNILMSLFQLGHFPGLVLHKVFSTAFISNVTSKWGDTHTAIKQHQRAAMFHLFFDWPLSVDTINLKL